MSSNAYKLQISLKTPHGTLINLPAESAAEATAALAAVREMVTDIVATEQILAGAHNAAPVVVLDAPAVAVASGEGTPPPAFTPPVAAATTPGCPHGPREFWTGVAKTGPKAGKPIGGWRCPERDRTQQCSIIWDNEYGK